MTLFRSLFAVFDQELYSERFLLENGMHNTVFHWFVHTLFDCFPHRSQDGAVSQKFKIQGNY